MDSLIKADIFFFISTFLLSAVLIVLLIALVYLIKILANFLYLSRKIKEEGDEVVKDFHSLRQSVKEESGRFKQFWKNFINFIINLTYFKKVKTKKKNKYDREKE